MCQYSSHMCIVRWIHVPLHTHRDIIFCSYYWANTFSSHMCFVHDFMCTYPVPSYAAFTCATTVYTADTCALCITSSALTHCHQMKHLLLCQYRQKSHMFCSVRCWLKCFCVSFWCVYWPTSSATMRRMLGCLACWPLADPATGGGGDSWVLIFCLNNKNIYIYVFVGHGCPKLFSLHLWPLFVL